MTDAKDIEVVAPNLKRRLSGVTATVVRLIPVQARMIGIVTTGPGLPGDLPHIPLSRAASLPRDRWRVWHARRNTEMALGLICRRLLGRRYRLLFTSAAQRHHTGFTKWLIRQQDALIATSPKAASYLERPATVILHGVDTQVFHPASDRRALRESLGLDPDAVLIGCFGRVRAQKGVDLMVEAALALFPAHPKAQMIFTGRITRDNQTFVDELKARLHAAGLADRVRFLGELPWEDVVRHYQALDLFAAPARWEGFGLTPLEAMACAVPVVASRVGAFETLIRDGETGSLIPPDDQAALTAALGHWLDDPAAREAAGRAALSHVRESHDIEGEARAITAVYRKLLA
ncbi:MAG TPA: glycosyltransferase family 4 protein [Paracoccus sp. (in: a-proteobacteria)]|uniref:glycosyltransferase family 4 protein n=1 Tax=uncultured Paracoccus sp. TaxID=189685 RepID=UPI0026151ABB|nr:glycosyltransferase family 4 protein [uncultured Paracoccus sp.]HMQ42240.1 glycosyltransferase family 4 protein [Paracoccus sp. (in: a-proteobacteria)]HMR37771.1 glycosyltransferase family 4 protein [Paracoccus sp. (in: a-proteobacteria)]